MADGEALRIVVPRYGAEVLGGSEALMRGLAIRLAAEGWRVEVFTSCARSEESWDNVDPPGRSLEEGVLVRRFPTLVPRPAGTFALASRAFFRCPSPLRPERAWVVAQGPWMPGLVRELRRSSAVPTILVPYLYHPTLLGIHAVPGIRILQPAAHDERPLRLRAVGRAVAACDALWYGTPEERALLERVHPAAAARPHEIGTVAVEAPTDIRPGSFAAAYGVRGPYLLFAGRATSGKGIETLVAAFDRVRRRSPTLSLVLAGAEERTRDPVRGIVSVGRLPRRTLWEALAGATAAVVPSSMESLSLLTLEAWAVARPVLVNAAAPALAGHAARTAGAIGYRDATELVDLVQRLLDLPEEATARGAAGHAHLQSLYRWDLVVQRLRRLVHAPPSGSRQRRAVLGTTARRY